MTLTDQEKDIIIQKVKNEFTEQNKFEKRIRDIIQKLQINNISLEKWDKVFISVKMEK